MRVALHGAEPPDYNRELDLNRVPSPGEYVSLDAEDEVWYCVTGVVHQAFEGAEFAAEIWVQPMDPIEAVRDFEIGRDLPAD